MGIGGWGDWGGVGLRLCLERRKSRGVGEIVYFFFILAWFCSMSA